MKSPQEAVGKATHIKKTVLRPKKNRREFLIWCDESASKGRYCSNFYGGLLVKWEDLREVQATLHHSCRRLHLFDEIKWHKVSQHYLEKYKRIMDVFFELVRAGKIRIRIMFRHNSANPFPCDKATAFFRLYYQFVRHAFGLRFSNPTGEKIFLRLYFDFLPYPAETRQAFKEHIRALQSTAPFQMAHLKIRKQDVTEVNSKRHLVLQMLDVVLGSVCYRFNNRLPVPSGEKPAGSQRKAAKEKLFQHIHGKLQALWPGIPIRNTTPVHASEDTWNHPYRQWVWNSKNGLAAEKLFRDMFQQP